LDFKLTLKFLDQNFNLLNNFLSWNHPYFNFNQISDFKNFVNSKYFIAVVEYLIIIALDTKFILQLKEDKIFEGLSLLFILILQGYSNQT
jgi:hypothetical protein